MIMMSHRMSHLTFSAFRSVFDLCVFSLKKCSPSYDSVHITGGNGQYGMSRKLVPAFYTWIKLLLCSVTKLRQELIWYCNFQITLNLLELELFLLIFSTPVNKMWITQEPNMLELWNKLNFEEEKMENIYHI